MSGWWAVENGARRGIEAREQHKRWSKVWLLAGRDRGSGPLGEVHGGGCFSRLTLARSPQGREHRVDAGSAALEPLRCLLVPASSAGSRVAY